MELSVEQAAELRELVSSRDVALAENLSRSETRFWT